MSEYQKAHLISRYTELARAMNFDWPITDDDITKIEGAMCRPVASTDLQDTTTPMLHGGRYCVRDKSRYYQRECWKELVRLVREMRSQGVTIAQLIAWRGPMSRNEVDVLRWQSEPVTESGMTRGRASEMMIAARGAIAELEEGGDKPAADKLRRSAKSFLRQYVDATASGGFRKTTRDEFDLQPLPDEYLDERRKLWSGAVKLLKDQIESM